jgi:hypothetical protein
MISNCNLYRINKTVSIFPCRPRPYSRAGGVVAAKNYETMKYFFVLSFIATIELLLPVRMARPGGRRMLTLRSVSRQALLRRDSCTFDNSIQLLLLTP